MKHVNYGLLAAGGLTGAANGMFGGGGGMIAVPALKRAGLPTKCAHATAIAAVLPATLVSAAVYLFTGGVPLSLLLPVACGVLAGGLLGARLLAVLPVRWISFVFSALMLAAGVGMLF